MIKQKLVLRGTKVVNEGTSGFNDYNTEYEPIVGFMLRVTSEINSLEGKFKGVQYINDGTDARVTGAIIVYKTKTKKG